MIDNLVRVVVPSSNGSYWIARTDDSVLGQPRRSMKATMVDEGSTYNTHDREPAHIRSRSIIVEGGAT
ncbi:MAG: hypothetical protein BGO98_24895 [Myxococcales bacterium 68-20]|nr:hypothetical protein [Myxococcales bacterium]OJY15900.1 MAG: hypothetical protein BGO98_24895 [Myxococcales bacterium 68-20]